MFVVIAGDSVFKCDDCLGPTSSTDKRQNFSYKFKRGIIWKINVLIIPFLLVGLVVKSKLLKVFNSEERIYCEVDIKS